MIPAKFEYKRASSAEEAISLVGEHGDEAKFLAGGHSLLPLMKLRLASPAVLVDIGRLRDLSYIRDGGDHVAIGALTRHRDIEISDMLKEHAPLLAHAASHVGDPQVRHRGTIGGSLAHADPASDLPATTLALGATYVAQGPNGTREIAAADFYQGFLESALAPDELLTEIRVPKMAGAGWGFQKFNRRSQDWAIVGVAAWRRNGDSGVGLVNMGSTPVLASAVSAALVRWGVGQRRGRAGRGRRRTPGRPQRQRGVPGPPGQGAGTPGPGGRQRLARRSSLLADRADLHIVAHPSYDAVVVGAGPNGLAAAVTLAQAGRSVLLVEAATTVGGGTRSAELTLPGFVHDVCSAIHPLAAGSPFLSQLPLERFGLRWLQPEIPLAHPLDGGRAALLRRSVDETARGLGADAAAYRRWIGGVADRWEELSPMITGSLAAAFPATRWRSPASACRPWRRRRSRGVAGSPRTRRGRSSPAAPPTPSFRSTTS